MITVSVLRMVPSLEQIGIAFAMYATLPCGEGNRQSLRNPFGGWLLPNGDGETRLHYMGWDMSKL
jgi:hypothetical protein